MSDDPLLTRSLSQNPAPFPESGQDFARKVQQETDRIMAQFASVLPSNYVSRISGPSYILQYRAAAEQLASFLITAQEVFKDSDWSRTRPEFLWELLGSVVFPDAGGGNLPQVDGDVAYRDFLRRMVAFLLRGSTASVMSESVASLTDGEVQLVERFIEARTPGSPYTIDDQFFVDLFVEGPPDQPIPADPAAFQSNVVLVLRALKPAHVLYGYTHLLREAFGPLFSDDLTVDVSAHQYDDLRKFCYGTAAVSGSAGVTLSGKTMFSDASRSFASVQPGGLLRVTGGSNEGQYRVTEILAFPVTQDTTPRAYATSPTGLSGKGTVAGDAFTDPAQDFSGVVEGEILTLSSGPCAGTYRIEAVLGLGGGPAGTPGLSSSTSVRVSKSLLRVEPRMASAASGQAYVVDADRLGVRAPVTVSGEDCSDQFYS